jgi:cell division protein FtsB
MAPIADRARKPARRSPLSPHGERPGARLLALLARRMLIGSVAAVAAWYAWLVARTSLYTRFVLGITAAICLALLVFGADEAWVRHRVDVRTQQVESENDQLKQDTAATVRQAEWAESAAAIEDEARAMGYARPGEQPIVIVTATPTSAP